MTPHQWRVTVSVLLLAAAALVQFAVLARLPVPAPDLVACVVIGLGMASGRTAGAVAGFGAGLVLDVLPPADGLVGAGALALLVVGHLAGTVRDPRGLAPVQVAGIAAGLTALAGGVQWLFALLLGAAVPAVGPWLVGTAITAVLTGVVAVAVVPAIGAVVRRVGEPGGRRRRRRVVVP